MLTPRPYQEECIAKAKEANTIVVLPTGTGKTLIAVKLIDHFLDKEPSKVVIFTVPTKALVPQQAAYCHEHCAGKPEVSKLCGVEMDQWDGLRWEKELAAYRVLVGTPEVFRQALEKRYLNPGRISLVIFDECHNAVGNSPMARILRDGLRKSNDSGSIRIVGLTASFVAGSLKRKRCAEASRIQLELLFQAQFHCPDEEKVRGESLDKGSDVPKVRTLDGASVTAEDPKWERLAIRPDKLGERFGAELDGLMDRLRNAVDPNRRVVDFAKVLGRYKHVFEELGLDALTFAIQNNLFQHLEKQAHNLIDLGDAAPRQKGLALKEALPGLRKKLQEHMKLWRSNDTLQGAPRISEKANRLVDLLRERLMPTGKGIVFVTQVILTVPLAKILTESIKDLVAVGVYGQMPPDQQNEAVDMFREGQLRCLVATDTLLEGIDVPDCQWVVRFNEFHTTKSHIQGSGRARSLSAKVFYFHNDPLDEHMRARMMQDVARDPMLVVNDEFRKAWSTREMRLNTAYPNVYPFTQDVQNQADSSQDVPIDFFNCWQIVFDWCQRVHPDNSFAADKVFEDSPEGDLISVRIPKPSGGELVVSRADVDKHWDQVQLEDVIDRNRLRKFTRREKERRRALFVAAVRMRQEGYIDSNNEPRTLHLEHAKCTARPPSPREPQVRVPNKFPREDLRVIRGDYKLALHGWAQREWPHLVFKDILQYHDSPTVDGWVSRLNIVPTDKHFRSVPCASKGAAQQDAAKAAYDHLVKEQVKG